jgi:hypothetical protein
MGRLKREKATAGANKVELIANVVVLSTKKKQKVRGSCITPGESQNRGKIAKSGRVDECDAAKRKARTGAKAELGTSTPDFTLRQSEHSIKNKKTKSVRSSNQFCSPRSPNQNQQDRPMACPIYVPLFQFI